MNFLSINFCLFVFGHYDSIKVHSTGTRLMNCSFGKKNNIPVFNGTVDLLHLAGGFCI